MSTQEPRIKRVGKHASDCRAMISVKRGSWDSPWWLSPEKPEYRDAIGRRNQGSCIWHVVSCNATNCEAKLLVREDWLLKGLPNE